MVNWLVRTREWGNSDNDGIFQICRNYTYSYGSMEENRWKTYSYLGFDSPEKNPIYFYIIGSKKNFF